MHIEWIHVKMDDSRNTPPSNYIRSGLLPPSEFSLLWPPGTSEDLDSSRTQLSPAAWRDLGLDNLVLAFTSDPEHRREIAKVLATLIQNGEVLCYRQEVLADLLNNPDLAERIESLLPTIDALDRYSYRAIKDTNTLHELTWRLGELQSIIDCVQGFSAVFDQAGDRITSPGLQAFQRKVNILQADASYQNLAKELPGLLGQFRACASVTIGVNLDPFLRPVEATLLAVNTERFTSPAVLTRLFGKQANSMEGIAPLHTVPKRVVDGSPYALPVSTDLGWAVDPLLVPLFADLAKIIEKTTRPISEQMKAYAQLTGGIFANLRKELAFYLGAYRFIRRLQNLGLPTCRPKLAAQNTRVCQVEAGYNLHLALQFGQVAGEQDITHPIILNDITMGPAGRIFILTGPNQGGKTTYMQAVAIIQVLAQVGLWVPGKGATISPVDNIYTHFPLEEKPEAAAGRFGEEAQRLNEIFRQVTPHSLVLLNESLSSTSAGESLYIAQDVVRALRRLGTCAIYSTHLHELADQVDRMNAATPGDSQIVSLVASPVEDDTAAQNGHQRSFKVEIRPPLGRSYATEIAARYGISYEQLENTLVERGQLSPK